MIKFNEVTWYSKLASVIVCLGLLPILIFYIGVEYEKAKTVNETTYPIELLSTAAHSDKKIFSDDKISFTYRKDFVICQVNNVKLVQNEKECFGTFVSVINNKQLEVAEPTGKICSNYREWVTPRGYKVRAYEIPTGGDGAICSVNDDGFGPVNLYFISTGKDNTAVEVSENIHISETEGIDALINSLEVK